MLEKKKMIKSRTTSLTFIYLKGLLKQVIKGPQDRCAVKKSWFTGMLQ